jgi:hypothetical protein
MIHVSTPVDQIKQNAYTFRVSYDHFNGGWGGRKGLVTCTYIDGDTKDSLDFEFKRIYRVLYIIS